MPPEANIEFSALVIGEGDFYDRRLARVLQTGGFEVCRKLDLSRSYAIGLIDLPGGPEVAMLYSNAVRLIGVEQDPGEQTASPGWPFERAIHTQMSLETILSACFDVIYRERCIRKYPRYPVSLEVGLIADSKMLRTTTVNFSEGGVFIRSLNPFPRDTSVRLRLLCHRSLEELRGRVLYSIGEEGAFIVRKENPDRPVVGHPGMAVKFNEGQEQAIKKWLRVAHLESSGQF